MLHVIIGDIRIRIMFGIFRDLAVDVFIVTTFIGRFINGIFPSERKIVPFNFPPMSILIVHDVEGNKTEKQQDGTVASIVTSQDS